MQCEGGKTVTRLKKRKTKNTRKSLNSVPCPLSYPIVSYSEQDSVLSLSGPSDPSCPHPLQRSPEAQQVHSSRPEPTWPESNPLLSSPHLQGAAVCWCLACVVLGKTCGGGVCVWVKSQIRGRVWGHDSSSFAACHQSTIYLLLSRISCMSASRTQ